MVDFRVFRPPCPWARRLLPSRSVASSRDVRSPLHVGRVTDPLAREDGVDEPEMQLDPTIAARDDEAGELPVLRRVRSETDASPRSGADSHPVRDRLLARAEEARREAAAPEQVDSKEDEGFASLGEELERVASRGPSPASPDLPRRRRDLAPNVIMLFGILLGLTLFAALFAVLVHLDPRDHSRIVEVSSPESTARPAPSA